MVCGVVWRGASVCESEVTDIPPNYSPADGKSFQQIRNFALQKKDEE